MENNFKIAPHTVKHWGCDVEDELIVISGDGNPIQDWTPLQYFGCHYNEIEPTAFEISLWKDDEYSPLGRLELLWEQEWVNFKRHFYFGTTTGFEDQPWTLFDLEDLTMIVIRPHRHLQRLINIENTGVTVRPWIGRYNHTDLLTE